MGNVRSQIGRLGLAALAAPAADDPRTPPEEFRLFRAGLNTTEKGPFIFDGLSAASVMDNYARHGVDCMIDYDHAAMTAGMGGSKALAAGWGKLAVRDGEGGQELWLTEITWTPAAAQHLGDGEYRYFSPLFEFDPETRQILKMINCALTNTPAMDGIDALVAASMQGAGTMNESEKKIAEQAAEIARLTARVQVLEAGESHAAALSTAVGGERKESIARASELSRTAERLLSVTGEKTTAAALGTIEGWKAAAAEAGELKAQAERAALSQFTKDIDAALDQASVDGKIPPANKDEWKADAIKMGGGKPSADGVAWLSAKIKNLPVIARSVDNPTNPDKRPNLDAESAGMAAILGIDHKKYSASRAAR